MMGQFPLEAETVWSGRNLFLLGHMNLNTRRSGGQLVLSLFLGPEDARPQGWSSNVIGYDFYETFVFTFVIVQFKWKREPTDDMFRTLVVLFSLAHLCGCKFGFHWVSLSSDRLISSGRRSRGFVHRRWFCTYDFGRATSVLEDSK